MSVKLFFLTVAIYCSIGAFCQTNGNEQLKSVRELFDAGDYEQAKLVCEEMIQRSRDSTILGKSYNNLGVIHWRLNELAAAIAAFEDAIDHAPANKRDSLVGSPSYNVGIIYKNQGAFKQSGEFLYASLKAYEETNDTAHQIQVLNAIGNLHRETDNFDQAINRFRRAEKLAKMIDNQRLYAQTLNHLGRVYLEIDYLDLSLKNLRLALRLKQDMNDSSHFASTQFNLGKAHLLVKRLDSAELYFKHSLDNWLRNSQLLEAADCLNYLGRTKYEKESYGSAMVYLDSAMIIIQRLNSASLLLDNVDLRKRIYKQKQNWKEFAYWSEEYLQVFKEVLGEEKQKALQALSIEYEVDQFRMRNQRLSEQNRLQKLEIAKNEADTKLYLTLTIASLIGIILLVIILILTLRTSRQRKAYSVRISNLMKETHHRIKNNLQTLQGLLTVERNNVQDEKYMLIIDDLRNRVSSMNLLHSNLSAASTIDTEYINLDRYITEIVENLVLTYGKADKILVNYQLQAVEMASPNALIIGLITNEVISNTLKYGLTSENPIIKVELELEKNNRAVLVLSDNGNYEKSKNESRGTGLGLIENLANDLEADYEMIVDEGMTHRLTFKTKSGRPKTS